MLTPAQVQEKLQDRVATIVATRTGLHANTIRDLKSGAILNPSYETMMKISAYLEDYDPARNVNR
jgi:hypothetical protein|tara:strand:- start:689 stop:883 length:195 start_codon:yes stop_codon:yes gene_type:complete